MEQLEMNNHEWEVSTAMIMNGVSGIGDDGGGGGGNTE